MDKEKEIEKLAKVMCRHTEEKPCKSCNQTCQSYPRAKKLIELGYGDVKQAQIEILNRLKRSSVFIGDNCVPAVMETTIDKLIKEIANENH